MLKLVVAAISAIALFGTANAAGWRSLRLDARDEASFTQSVAAFEKKLSPERWYVFRIALHDIWSQGTKSAAADQREYTATDYLRQLHGLHYEQIVTFTDPTGETARRNEAAYSIWPSALDVPQRASSVSPGRYTLREFHPIGRVGEQLHGSPDLAQQR